MRPISHTPSGSGHPYRVDPDQRWPVQLVGDAAFELRLLAAPGVGAVEVEFGDGSRAEMVATTVDELYGAGAAGTGGHLAAASGARPEVGDRVPWRVVATAPAAGSVRYRFTAGEVATEWYDAAVGNWQPAGGRVALSGDPLGDHLAVGEIEWLVTADGPVRVRVPFALEADEHVVGFGERFDALDQRGRALDTVVFEQYKGQGNRTYLPSPFAIVAGGAGWGFHLRTGRRVWFDVGASRPDRLVVELTVEPDDPVVDIAGYSGPPAAVLGAHVAAEGGLRRPPDWVWRPWMSANNWNTQDRVVEEVDRSLALGVPVGVVVIEAWSDESTFTVFRDARHPVRAGGEPLTLADIDFPPDGAWPDPVAMTRYLHDAGVRVVLWQIPLVPCDRDDGGQVAADAATMVDRGYCVREADGSPYRNRGRWFPGALLPDWTNPDARRWWLAKRRYLLTEVGVDGFKTDGGEHAWGDDLRYFDGGRGSDSNNRFAQRYADAYTSLLDECGVAGVTFSRAGYTGAGRAPCHWAGDESSTWEAFRASIVAGLTAGASGVAFWGWDLGGFSGPLPNVELYVRAAAMAALCPIMQYHSEFDVVGVAAVGGEAAGRVDPADPAVRSRRRDRTPWNVAERSGDERALTLYRRFAVMRERLLPYLAGQADVSVATGLPMMRALCFGFPDDRAVWDFPFEYQLGDDLLVAPVCDEGADSVEVYLPAGAWVDVWNGRRHEGPGTLCRPVPLDEIAVYAPAARAAALVPAFADLPGSLGSGGA